ncbi:hypothetical protein T08_12469 [Trichinella sp. T8]|nr:hypothetical protein T08_12469 [Trichinella sp. T8]
MWVIEFTIRYDKQNDSREERKRFQQNKLLTQWRSEATPTGELGGQEKPDWLGGQQPDERGSDEEQCKIIKFAKQ